MADTKLDIRVYPINEPKSNTVAFASVAVDGLIAIRGIRVVDSEKGLFVTMPQSQDKDKKYHDIAFPINGDLRKEINKAVLDEYDSMANLAADQRGYDKPDINTAVNINAADIKLDIRVYPVKNQQGSTKAFANVTVNDLIAIRNVRIVDSEKGLFVTMPQSQDKDKKYHDVAFPLSGDLRKEITRAVLEKYEAGDKSLASGLCKGAEKAAESAVIPRESTDKSRNTEAI